MSTSLLVVAGFLYVGGATLGDWGLMAFATIFGLIGVIALIAAVA